MLLNRSFVLAVVIAILLVGQVAYSAVMVSGDDRQVRATTICTDSSGQNIVLFWESKQFSSGTEHLRFNRSTNGGRRWKTQSMEFPLNNNNVYFSDYLPETSFDMNSTLHVLWSQRTDTQSPSFAQTTNMGDTWSAKSNIGNSNLPRYEGLAMCAPKDASALWAFYADYDWHSYVSTSADSGKSWSTVDGPAAGDPLKAFCSSAAVYGERRYVFRIRDEKPEILAYDGVTWSSYVPETVSGVISIAENHTIAVDSKGRIYVVYAEAGKLWCLRSDDQGKSFSSKVAIMTNEQARVPVMTVTKKDYIAVAWEQGTQVRYSVSSDSANSFPESKIVARSSDAQTAPDVCSVGESLYFSFTQNGAAWFAGQPDVHAIASTRISKKNLLSNPQFDAFHGQAPTGWTVDSWNQKFLKERFGRMKPGRGGAGSCLEMKEGSGAAIIEFTGPKTAVEADAAYLLKGYYASTCQKTEVIGSWIGSDGKEISSVALVLPETQDRWTEFFDEIYAPIGSVLFRISIRKKWQTGRARFDDFSLRIGTLQNFANEFSLPPLKFGELRYPIFGWCTPGCWSDGNTYPLKYYNSEKAFAEYAMANFTVGRYAKFGTMRQGGVSANDENLIKDAKDPSVLWIHGGDEPGMSAFPELARVHERVRKLAPSKPYMINLLPTYGFPSYAAFEEYLDAYIKTVKPVIFTYDFYSLGGPNNGYSKDFFANYEISRKHALKNNIDWGVILGVTAFGGIRSPNDAELRWQAFTSLAYGSKALGWFTYLTEVEYGGMNWRDAAINWDGSRSKHYTMLRRLNGEVLKLGNVLLRLKSTGVYHTKPLPELTRDIKDSELIQDISSGQWVLGEFVDSKKRLYFMLVNRDYAKDQKAVISLAVKVKGLSTLDATTGKWVKVSAYDKQTIRFTSRIAKGDARLYRVE